MSRLEALNGGSGNTDMSSHCRYAGLMPCPDITNPLEDAAGGVGASNLLEPTEAHAAEDFKYWSSLQNANSYTQFLQHRNVQHLEELATTQAPYMRGGGVLPLVGRHALSNHSKLYDFPTPDAFPPPPHDAATNPFAFKDSAAGALGAVSVPHLVSGSAAVVPPSPASVVSSSADYARLSALLSPTQFSSQQPSSAHDQSPTIVPPSPQLCASTSTSNSNTPAAKRKSPHHASTSDKQHSSRSASNISSDALVESSSSAKRKEGENKRPSTGSDGKARQGAISPKTARQEKIKKSLESIPTITTEQVHESDALLETDKKKLYGHPLFPLLALLFDKCEQATHSFDRSASSSNLSNDTDEFAKHASQKTLLTGEVELDNGMVLAIQVLRIHLLELEKVNDLCKDFCQRYIACMKTKLQNDVSFNPPEFRLDTTPVGAQVREGATPGMLDQSQMHALAAGAAQGEYGSNTTLLDDTLYQMVHTPHGLIAHPVSRVRSAMDNKSQHDQVRALGETPLSQIGRPMMSPGQGDEPGRDSKLKRGTLPKASTNIMKSWLFQHIVHPYPTEDEKRVISQQAGLSLLQVNNWFINARRRILQPMLDATNPDGSTKSKKSKSNSNTTRSSQQSRFWPETLAMRQNKSASDDDAKSHTSEDSELERMINQVPDDLDDDDDEDDEPPLKRSRDAEDDTKPPVLVELKAPMPDYSRHDPTQSNATSS